MLDRIWPADGLKTIVGLDLASRKARREAFFATAEEAMAAAAEMAADPRLDIYFAPATMQSEKRAQANVHHVQAFWIDMDAGEGKDYPTREAALSTLLFWVKEHSFPSPSCLVSSGYGLHVYWALTGAVTGEAWLPVARAFKAALSATGLRVDRTRTADSASLLRLPGTVNRKGGKAAPVEVLLSDGPAISFEDFQRAIPRVGPVGLVPDFAPDKPRTLTIDEDYPPADITLIRPRCQQMRRVQEAGGKVPEPLWRAALSVLWRCEGANSLIHDWSRGDPRYDAHETEAKARGTVGPLTCESFEDANPGGCDGCPMKGRISSPIVLGTPEPPPKLDDSPEGRSASVPPDDGWLRLDALDNWTVTDNGVRARRENEEGDAESKVVTLCPIWLRELRQRERAHHLEPDLSTLGIHWRAMDGSTHYATLPQRDLYDARAFTRWLADHNLIAQVVDLKELVAYMRRYTLEILKAKRVRRHFDAMGWYNDRFVAGPWEYRETKRMPALVPHGSTMAKLEARGTLAAWRAAIEPLGRPELAPAAFTIMAAFGSPLLALANRKSAVLSLAGPTSKGKTLAAKTALSIYGDPDLLHRTGNSTMIAIDTLFAQCRHLPVLVDETTFMKPEDLATLILNAANGTGRARADRAGSLTAQKSWALVPIFTTNRPLAEYADSVIESQQRSRLLELGIVHGMTREEIKEVAKASGMNAGAPAPAYLHKLVSVREAVPEMFDELEETIARKTQFDRGHRFPLWTLTAAVLGGIIAKEAGVLPFDPWRVLDNLMPYVREGLAPIVEDSDRIAPVLADFVNMHRRDICFWSPQSDRPAAEVPDRTLGRYDRDADKLYLAWGTIREHLATERISPGNLREWADKHEVRLNVAARLAPGLPAVRAMILSPSRVGMPFAGDTLGSGAFTPSPVKRA